MMLRDKQGPPVGESAPHCLRNADTGEPTKEAYKKIAARDYALWELSRRAGVTREQFSSWRIEHGSERDVIWINGLSPLRIEFPVARAEFWNRLSAGWVEVARAGWMFAPAQAIANTIQDFVVPFSNRLDNGQPLFYPVDSTTVACSVDLLTSILLTLTRYEETISAARDEDGRFPSEASLAAKHGFLDRPIVDEYGLAFEQAISYLIPGWAAPARELRVKLSHDIDELGVPLRIRTAVGHTLARRKPLATFQDFAAAVSGKEPSYLGCVRKLCELSLERGLDSALYWKSPPATDHDQGYSLFDPRIQGVIRWARDQGIELGAHPGYYTYASPGNLREQVEYVRRAIGERRIGGRQHYLRWSPRTWQDWEACEFAYDSTVGYADRIGFRAGTCIPYKPWFPGPGRAANLLEIPLIVMDVTLLRFMGVSAEDQCNKVMPIVERCRIVGGVFTLLWHNTSLLNPCYGDTYIQLLDRFAGGRRFSWEDELRA